MATTCKKAVTFSCGWISEGFPGNSDETLRIASIFCQESDRNWLCGAAGNGIQYRGSALAGDKVSAEPRMACVPFQGVLVWRSSPTSTSSICWISSCVTKASTLPLCSLSRVFVGNLTGGDQRGVHSTPLPWRSEPVPHVLRQKTKKKLNAPMSAWPSAHTETVLANGHWSSWVDAN